MQLDMFNKATNAKKVEQDKHFYYVNGVLGMKNDGTFTDEKRHWMTFTRETAIPMQEGNEKPSGATHRGVFVGIESGDRLKIAKPVTPQVPGGDMEKYIKVAADSIEQLRKIDVYRVLVESNRVEFRQAIASYIKSKRPDLIEEVDEVMMEAGVGMAEQGTETKVPAKAVGLDEVRTEYPFGKVLREDQFFGSKVRVLSTGMNGDADWEGTVQSTLNGGRLFSVKRDGTEFSVRIGGDRIDVLERVEYGVGAAKEVATLPDAVGEASTAEQEKARDESPQAGASNDNRDVNVGREWQSEWGTQRIIERLEFKSGDLYSVKSPNGLMRRYSVGQIEDVIKHNEFSITKEAEQKRAQDRLVEEKHQELLGKRKVESEAAEVEKHKIDGFGENLDKMRLGKVEATLAKELLIEGKPATLRDAVRTLVNSGATTSTDQIDVIKDMTRVQFNRADQRTQDEHAKKQREAGKKTEYYVGDYELGKTAYDYANHLIAMRATVSKLISNPVTESIKRNNAHEQQFNRDAQYVQLMTAKREDVQGIVDGMSVEDTQVALDRLNAAPGDNLPVRASLAVKLDRADKAATLAERNEVWQMTRNDFQDYFESHPQRDPWEMDKREFEKAVDSGFSWLHIKKDGKDILADQEKYGAYKSQIKWAAETALSIGKTVPAEVLAEFCEQLQFDREVIARLYSATLAEGRAGVSPEPSDYHYSFADHILNKDAYRLDHLANGLNDEGKRVFTAVTGVELPKQQGATWAAIREWGGISLEEDNKNKAWKQVVFERQQLEPKVGVDPLLWANDKVEKGFAELKKVGRETWLVHADGQGFNLSMKGTHQTMLVPYLEAKIKYEQARAACELSVATAVEGCVSEGTFSGAVLSVADGVAVQKISRDGATANHDVSKLSGKVAVGDMLDINYRDGVGVVGGKALAGEVTR